MSSTLLVSPTKSLLPERKRRVLTVSEPPASRVAPICEDSDIDEFEEKQSPTAAPSVSLQLSRLSTKGMRRIRTVLGYTGFLSTDATGRINSSATTATIATTAEFVSFASLFDEFFIHSFTVHYLPYNQNMTQPSMSYSTPASGMLLAAPIYHGAGLYTSANAMANSGQLSVLSTGKPWRCSWRNNESPTGGVSSSSSTSSPTASQSWCLTAASNAALYTGRLQFLNQGLLTAALSSSVGELIVRFDISFRVRG